MAKEHETIADIIAEKRREANYIVQVSQGKCQTRRDKAEDEARDIRREADRIEAALRREKAEWVNVNAGLAKLVDIEKVGDCAKLREAASYLASIFDCDIQFLERHAKELRDTGAYGGGIIEHILHSITLAKAALAAPPRNCDRDLSDRRSIWAELRQWVHATSLGCATEPSASDAFEWLLAPATEQEGGAK